MAFNYLIKISQLARRNFGLKSKIPVTASHVPLRTVLPFINVNGKKLFDKRVQEKVKVCYFRVTSPNNALPPVLIVLFRYVVKISAAVTGRVIRKWWQKLPPEEKEKVLDHIRQRKSKIAFGGAVFAAGSYLYYLGHIVETPITQRKRFMMLNSKQMVQIADFEYKNLLNLYRSEIVPSYHPLFRRVTRVANSLLYSNSDIDEIRDKTWSVTVIDKPEVTNAFALPHGKIFVFSGMLNICTNDDQLAIVLAHEISHSILSHSAEILSKAFLVDFLLIIPSLVLWTIFPDAWALFSDFIMANLTKICIHLPFSRACEREADFVGLLLAAKSCFDVREAPVFWTKMNFVNNNFPVEFLSTHPANDTRQQELKELLPEALEIRDLNECPPLVNKVRLW